MKQTMNSTVAPEKESGYDLPVYGLDNGQFYYIHIPAICCIFLSLCCIIITITLSFRRQSYRTFFSWSKNERFIVYLAICDGGYNVFHSVDHLHIVIAKNHVYPKQLCEFYGFTLAEFIMSQNLMVNVVAINAFMLMYFNNNINFGKYDWRLLIWTYGAPFLGATIAGIAQQLGPNGSFCYFDGVKGTWANLFFTTVPLLLIMAMNSVMYILTWKKIKERTKGFRASQKQQLSVKKNRPSSSSQRAAKTMSFFVLAFFIQWWSMALFGVWALIDDVPQVIHHFVTTFTNLGGCLNLGVYYLMKRRGGLQGGSIKTDGSTSGHGVVQSTSGTHESDM